MILPSPDNRWICRIQRGAEGEGQEVTVQTARYPDSARVLWRSPRWVAVDWSPDGRFLAVTDHYDGHESKVLVFAVPDVARKEFDLIFETPRDADKQVAWLVERWNSAKDQVVLRRKEDRLGQEPRYAESLRDFDLLTR